MKQCNKKNGHKVVVIVVVVIAVVIFAIVEIILDQMTFSGA